MQDELNMVKNLMREKEMKNSEEIDDLDTEKISEELQKLRELVRKRNEECDEISIKYNLLKDEKNILEDKLKDMKLEYEKSFGIGVMSYSHGQKYELEKLQREFKNVLNKKKYYKEQCKLCNDIIDVIKKKLTKEQYKEIENDKSFQKFLNIKYGNKMENSNIYINNKSNNSINNINIKENSKINNNSNINFENENNNNNINVYNNNNNIILDNKFNSNINNNIDTKNDKGKNNNNDDDIPENISYYESIQK